MQVAGGGGVLWDVVGADGGVVGGKEAGHNNGNSFRTFNILFLSAIAIYNCQ